MHKARLCLDAVNTFYLLRKILILSIHQNLRLLFPQNRDLAYRWMTTRNKAFENLTPVEVVKESGFAGLLMVRGYLDRAMAM